MLYFIGNLEEKIVKIGITENISNRLKTIQTYCPFKLELFKLVKGDVEFEKELHLKFKHLNTHGEWFKLEDEVLNYIDSLNSYTPESSIKDTVKDNFKIIDEDIIDEDITNNWNKELQSMILNTSKITITSDKTETCKINETLIKLEYNYIKNLIYPFISGDFVYPTSNLNIECNINNKIISKWKLYPDNE